MTDSAQATVEAYRVLIERRGYRTTSEAATDLGIKPKTLIKSFCTKGHYYGLIPKKLQNGRLAWPVTNNLTNS